MDSSGNACLIGIIVTIIFLLIISYINKKSNKNQSRGRNMINTLINDSINNFQSTYKNQEQVKRCMKCGRTIPLYFNDCPYCKDITDKDDEMKRKTEEKKIEKITVEMEEKTICCPECGEEIDKDLVICPNCGKFIEDS